MTGQVTLLPASSRAMKVLLEEPVLPMRSVPLETVQLPLNGRMRDDGAVAVLLP